MDNTARYRDIVCTLLHEYARFGSRNAGEEIETEAVFDDTLGHYEVMRSGWNGDRRVHGTFLHVDIRGGKVWIQHDGTDCCLACELEEAGIPKSDIVLAFQHPKDRPFTGYAIG